MYDPAPLDEDDLWFLPGPDTGLDDPAALPLPQADRTPLVQVADWRAAEAALAGPLADLAMWQGMFAERLRQGPAGWQRRLALQEAADLSWLAGDRIPMDRLALWLTLRLPGDADDTQELVRAGWAVRRLDDGLMPADDLASFLGRRDQHARLTDQIADWQEIMGEATGLHRITQGALGFHIWPVTGLSQGHALGGAAPLPLMEAAVVAARHSMGGVGSARLFQPLALGGALGLRATGTAADRLQRWIAGAQQATRAALRQLDALTAWERAATAACAGLSGRTPPQLVTLLRNWPLISAPMAEAQTGASRAAIQRNLNWMTQHGIAREMTGQGRYRFWTAALS